jgi:hypothetical protein
MAQPSGEGTPSIETDVSRAPETAALPVQLALAGSEAAAVRRWVEGTLGWQPVEGDTATVVPPALTLVDAEGSAIPDTSQVASAGVRVPRVLLLDAATGPVTAAEIARRCAPAAVLGWPEDRGRLSSVAAAVLAEPRPDEGAGRTIRIGGAAGGVGTTTVVLALAGLEAWSGTPSLAAVRQPAPDRPAVLSAALADPDLWARSLPLPGVPDARAVHLTDHEHPPEPVDRRIGTTVLDAGVDPDVDVLVCRRDAAALDALAVTTAAAIVVVGTGPVGTRELVRAASGRRGVALPWSARVARAGLHGRVPGSLPGAWLRRLAPLVPGSRLRRWGYSENGASTADSEASARTPVGPDPPSTPLRNTATR